MSFLFFCFFSAYVKATPVLKSFKGYWVYGFEQSIIETCDGQLYWAWMPDGFTGKYQTEGYKNPVTVSGYILPLDPDTNMYSPLNELKITHIKHVDTSC